MKLFVASLAMLAGSAAAFAPGLTSPASKIVLRAAESETTADEGSPVVDEEATPVAPPKMQGKVKPATPFKDELGAQMPLGYFDPMNMCTGDCTQEKFDGMRSYELTHGRVAMLAVTGYLVTAAGYRFPGAEDIPDGIKAFHALSETTDGKNVLVQMAVGILFMTIANRDDAEWTGATPEFVGDYRNGALDFGWDKLNDKTKMRKRAIELNNGRAAMMGITGLVVHEIMGVSILPGGYLPGH